MGGWARPLSSWPRGHWGLTFNLENMPLSCASCAVENQGEYELQGVGSMQPPWLEGYNSLGSPRINLSPGLQVAGAAQFCSGGTRGKGPAKTWGSEVGDWAPSAGRELEAAGCEGPGSGGRLRGVSPEGLSWP